VPPNPAERPALIDFTTCDRPAYPPDELRAKHTGMVKLNFLIGTDGAIKHAAIGTSSGYPGLDQAALAALSRCRFTPGTSAGAPAEKWSPVLYRWSIE
jgi:TonB family protein